MATKIEVKKNYDLKKAAIIETNRLSEIEKDLEHYRNWTKYVQEYSNCTGVEEPSLS